MTPMAAMTAVHKEMHHKTAEKEGKWQIWSEMLAMVNDKIQTSCCEEDAEHPADSGVFHMNELIRSFKTGVMHPDHIGTRDNGY